MLRGHRSLPNLAFGAGSKLFGRLLRYICLKNICCVLERPPWRVRAGRESSPWRSWPPSGQLRPYPDMTPDWVYLRHWGLPSSPGITFVTLVKKIMVLLESEPSLNFGFATLFSRSHQNCSTPQPPNGERTRTKLCNKSRMRRELRV